MWRCGRRHNSVRTEFQSVDVDVGHWTKRHGSVTYTSEASGPTGGAGPADHAVRHMGGARRARAALGAGQRTRPARASGPYWALYTTFPPMIVYATLAVRI
jgi:hypothetical protein